MKNDEWWKSLRSVDFLIGDLNTSALKADIKDSIENFQSV